MDEHSAGSYVLVMRKIVSTPDVLSGAYRIDGTRIDVRSIIRQLELGTPVEELAAAFRITAEEIAQAIEWTKARPALADRLAG